MSADDGTPAAGDMGDDTSGADAPGTGVMGTPPADDQDDEASSKVLCPDHPLGEDPSSSEYCDCEGDCTDPERSAWCSCSEAQLCCATASGDDTSAGDDGTPAASGDMHL